MRSRQSEVADGSITPVSSDIRRVSEQSSRGGTLIHGTSNHARTLRDEAAFVAKYRCHVLLNGETGTGKDVFLDEVARLAPGWEMVRVPAPELSDDALRVLISLDYPGNIRELENILWAGVKQLLRSGGGKVLTERHLAAQSALTRATAGPRRQKLSAREIVMGLDSHRSVASAARTFGIGERSLQRQMKDMSDVSPENDGRSELESAR